MVESVGMAGGGATVALDIEIADDPAKVNLDDQASPTRSLQAISRTKTFVAALFLFFATFLNDFALAFIHDRVPDRSVRPLPDLWFTWFPEVRWTIKVTETLMLISAVVTLATLIFHQYRWIAIRRVFFVSAICYLLRALCISILQVPVPSDHTFCAPKSQHPGLQTALGRMGNTLLSLGMDLYRGRVLCGDLIVSGHTITLVVCYLSVKQYAPRRVQAVFTFVLASFLAIGVVCILMARKHYTIDVVLAYFMTTRVFWIYHSLVQEPSTSLSSVWWYPFFRIMESDAPKTVFNRFQWPSGCPQLLKSRWNNRRR